MEIEGTKEQMQLENFGVVGDQVVGNGSDNKGIYQITGTWNKVQINFIKSYNGEDPTEYSGVYKDGKLVNGRYWREDIGGGFYEFNKE